MLGTAGAYTGATTIANGTLSIANSSGAGSSGTTLNLGTSGTTGNLNYLGAGGGALYGGTGAGETFGRTININNTANNVIFANQTGTAPTALTISTLTAGTATSASLYLGGSSTLNNTISAAIPASTALTIGKTGTGTWVLSGNNLYTGSTAVYGGTLIIDASSVVSGTSTKLSDTGAIVFNSDATSAAVSATAATGGWTGLQTAGGTFIFKGATTGTGTLETVGALMPAGGVGNVTIDPTSASGTKLTFLTSGNTQTTTAASSASTTVTVGSTTGLAVGMTMYGGSAAATISSITNSTQIVVSAAQTISSGATLNFSGRAAGAVLNFTPNSGAIAFTNASINNNGIMGGYAALNGVDFVGNVTAGGSVAAATYTALPATTGSSTTNYISAGSMATTGAIAANSLKINGGGTVSGTGALTITATNAAQMGGILFDNSGGAGGISGFTSITTSTANQELIFYTGGSTPTNAFTVSSPLANGTGSVTKAGTGTLVLGGNNTFTGNLVINEGTVKASGATANLLGTISTAGNITSIRQTGTLDINGAGTSSTLYGSVTAPLVTIGALQGGGSTSPSLAAQTTITGAVSNSNTVIVNNATGIALGQTVTGLGGVGIGGYPIVTGISGTTITLSSPQTLASGATLNFVNYVTSGATITNGGANSAISLGASWMTPAKVLVVEGPRRS
jgi:autotransporter-associated beta strand protein